LDRKIVYPGQIPLETDLLGTNQATMVALGKLSAAMFGTGGMVSGLTVGPNTPAALNVVVAPGEIYQLQNLESAAYSSLPADTTHTIVKQGVQLDSVVLPCPAPATAGFSINYLIEATFVENDVNPVTLPYYNASNPTQAYSGPNNTGASQATARSGQVQLQAKAGVAAATGTQVTPTVDAGYIALGVVTVANAQTVINAGSIVAATGGQLLRVPLSTGRLLNVQVFTTSGMYFSTPGTNSIIPEGNGGAGGGGSCPATSASQQSTAFGGLSGGYARARFTSGFSGGLPVTIGSGGNGGATGGNVGAAGGATTLGTLLSIPGGNGGGAGSASPSPLGVFATGVQNVNPTVTGGVLLASQAPVAGSANLVLSLSAIVSGGGGDSLFGRGGRAVVGSGAGNPGFGFGAGGSGAVQTVSSAGAAGGNGTPGILVIYEFG
jgi:hypothetical protein